MLLVMMMTVFLKSTVRPCPSVSRPSSSTCSSTLNTSGCAFSTSSRSTTQYGRRRTASVSAPPSSYPTYPGGAPISLATECFSPYSPLSIRIIASSLPLRQPRLRLLPLRPPVPQLPVPDPRRPLQVAAALGLLQLRLPCVHLLLHRFDRIQLLLLRLPARRQRPVLLLQLAQFP